MQSTTLLNDHQDARLNLVNCQLMPNKITDQRLLKTFLETPREPFLEPAQRALAYVDTNIQTDSGRSLVSPFLLARLLNAAQLKPTDTALVIGFGTGYSLAILGQLVGRVVGIECDPTLFDQASDALVDFGIPDLSLECRDLMAGYPEEGPFEAVIIEGAVATVPQNLLDQLKDSGRLVTILKKTSQMASGVVYTKSKDGISEVCVFDANIGYLPKCEPQKSFSFS